MQHFTLVNHFWRSEYHPSDIYKSDSSLCHSLRQAWSDLYLVTRVREYTGTPRLERQSF